MNYDKIILELLDRIKVLEEKVAKLEQTCKTEQLHSSSYSPERGNLTAKAREFIAQQKNITLQSGKHEVILLCNDIQKALGVTNRAPAICAAMYDCMSEGDEVLFAPPSGKSTTVKIKYYVR